MVVAVAPASSAQSAGTVSFYPSATAKPGQAGQDNPFQELLALLADLNSGQPLSGSDLQKLSQLEDNNPAVDPNAAQSSKNSNLALALNVDQNSADANATDGANGDLTAAQISMLAALLQQNPQLQVLFSGNVDLKSLSGAVNALVNGQTDLAQFNLPQSAQNILQPMANQQPGELTAMQKLLADMQNSNQLDQNQLNDLMALAKQMNLQQVVSDNAGNPPVIATVKIVTAPAQPTSSNTAVSQLKQIADERDALENNDLSTRNHVAQSSTANGQHKSTNSDNQGQADNAGDTDKTAPAVVNKALNGDFAQAAQKTVGNAAPIAVMVDPLAAAQIATNNNAAQAASADATTQTAQVNAITAAAAQTYNNLQSAVIPAGIPPAVMQAAIQIQQNAQNENNNFIVQLYPEELGQIQVNMKFEGNRVTAKISADKQETLDLMKQDSGILHKALQDAGLQTDSGTLEFSLSNSGQNLAQQKTNNNDSGFGTMLANNNSEENITAAAAPVYQAILAPGRVDVKL